MYNNPIVLPISAFLMLLGPVVMYLAVRDGILFRRIRWGLQAPERELVGAKAFALGVLYLLIGLAFLAAGLFYFPNYFGPPWDAIFGSHWTSIQA